MYETYNETSGLLLIKLDAAGRADALEISFLLSSDAVAADVELGQRPFVGEDIRDVSLWLYR
jgi:hypothetical protein